MFQARRQIQKRRVRHALGTPEIGRRAKEGYDGDRHHGRVFRPMDAAIETVARDRIGEGHEQIDYDRGDDQRFVRQRDALQSTHGFSRRPALW